MSGVIGLIIQCECATVEEVVYELGFVAVTLNVVTILTVGAEKGWF